MNWPDWLRPEIFWLALGIVLMFLELAMPGVILVFFGAGAIITAILAWTGVLSSTTGQMLCFVVSSVVMLFALRRYFRRFFGGRVVRGREYDEREEYQGKTARVTCAIVPGTTSGRIEFDGCDWKAVASETIAEGSSVEIVGKDNITFTVRPLPKKGDV